MRYTPDMIILKTRPEVMIKMTQGWDVTFCHPKMHSHTKFGVPTLNNIRDMLLTLLF